MPGLAASVPEGPDESEERPEEEGKHITKGPEQSQPIGNIFSVQEDNLYFKDPLSDGLPALGREKGKVDEPDTEGNNHGSIKPEHPGIGPGRELIGETHEVSDDAEDDPIEKDREKTPGKTRRTGGGSGGAIK